MSVDEFVQNVKEELESVPRAEIIPFLKKRIRSVEDPDDRRIIEGALSFIPLVMGTDKDGVKPCSVILVHGIRTYAVWHSVLENRLKDYDNVECHPVGFGFMDALRFWVPVPWFREKKKKIVLSHIRDIKFRNPDSEFVVVAHSFGTYILSKILEEESDLGFSRVLFCGSIVNEGYRWDLVPNFSAVKVVNDCGTRDYWPFFAKALSIGYGASGSVGFESARVTDRYHDCDHCGFFDECQIDKYWVPFIVDGELVSSEWNSRRDPPPYVFSYFGQDLIPRLSFVVVVLGLLLLLLL